MNKKDTFRFYEKLYFHEIVVRENLTSRQQIPLTIIIAFVGMLAFFLQNYQHRGFSLSAYLFFVLMFLAFFSLLAATICFVGSWWNHTYSFLPSAQETENYRRALVSHYEPYEDAERVAEEAFADYLETYYISCSSTNTSCNDRRSLRAYYTATWLIATAIIAFFAFLVFLCRSW
jgi:hypothetical protein